MHADADIQVWLDTQLGAQQALIVPYVRSASDAQLQYRIALIQHAGGGTSRINQQGRVALTAGQPASLPRLAVNPAGDGTCRLQVELQDDGKEIGTFDFDCSAKP